MTLQAGTRLGPYEILSPLGAGGMGEVYRARDTKLNRDVAIKVLPDAVATDAERLARFHREAQVLASLNHPNIAAIYGFEDSNATHALIMELVEGPTLADRVAQGPIPLNEALPIAKQIAEALEAAHEQGIIHRDLKPANVKVREDGTVKVLDFGLAKLIDPAASSNANAAMSPTLSLNATMAGVILGTAAYMSPEQAAGKLVDRRADIWSFGVVLWEMLTGRRLFDGETVSHTLADVLRAPIDFEQLPTPPRAIRELVKRCLDRDVTTRLRDIGEARIAIQKCVSHATEEPDTTVPIAAGRSTSKAVWAVSGVAAVFAVACAGLMFVHLRETPPEVRVVNTTLAPPDGTEFVALPALSPDGTRIVFGARATDGKTQLYVRRLDASTAQPLPGTEDALFPFWSPDSRWVAFGQTAKLKKVDVQGGPPVTVTAVQGSFRGGSWDRDGVILFGSGNGTAIMRVAASGGAAAPAIPQEQVLPDGRGSPVYPWFLPDGRHFLYTTLQDGDIPVRVGSLDEPGKPGKVIAQAHSNVAFAEGHLLYLRGSTLMAQLFDPERLETSGEAVPVAEGVPTFMQPSRGAMFTVSAGGLLAFQARTGDGFRLVRKDREGKDVGTLGEVPGRATGAIFSPDGTRLAAGIEGETTDIWIVDAARGIPARFTFGPASHRYPVWSPDGNTLYYSSTTGESINLYRKASNGASPEELLLSDSAVKVPSSVAPDGKSLLYSRLDPKTKSDLWLLSLESSSSGGKPESRPFLQTPFAEVSGQFSPDGKWVVYQSNESGTAEVYSTPYPGPGGKLQVSSGGGISPMWRHDGRELFYRTGGQLMAVEIAERNGTLDIGRPHPLFGGILADSTFAASPDGQKFVVSEINATTTSHGLTLVQNWTAALKK